MTKKETRANLLLLLAAVIWGFAFAAQCIGADYMQAFTFNGIRFFLGGLSILPIILLRARKSGVKLCWREPLKAGCITGFLLFTAAYTQQRGLEITTAGNGGFITALYIVLVPIVGVFMGRRMQKRLWLAIALALVGLYFLCVTPGAQVNVGDLWVLGCAVLFTAQILSIDRFTKRMDPLQMAFCQFMVCALLNGVCAALFEQPTLSGVIGGIMPLLYGGIGSVGVAYSLQAVAQRDAKPTHAALLMSLESVFSVIGGILFLGDSIGTRSLIGCALMFSAVILAQDFGRKGDAAHVQT